MDALQWPHGERCWAVEALARRMMVKVGEG
jgi:hypothetical protein